MGAIATGITKLNFEIDLGDVEQSAKVDGHGQAKILSDDDLVKLFGEGLTTRRDRALFATCLFTGCRVSEACQLRVEDVRDGLISFRKGTTKTKATRQVDMPPALLPWLQEYRVEGEYLFPGRHGRGHLRRQSADLILRGACDRVGLQGVSTHSFRRTYITRLRDKGYSPAQIQLRTGHRQRSSLLGYFDQV